MSQKVRTSYEAVFNCIKLLPSSNIGLWKNGTMFGLAQSKLKNRWKNGFDQLLGARSTRKLVEIHNKEVCTASSIVLLLNMMGHNIVFKSSKNFIRNSLYKYIDRVSYFSPITKTIFSYQHANMDTFVQSRNAIVSWLVNKRGGQFHKVFSLN